MIPELAALRERKGLQLSGGQQKLCAQARALMCGTKLLLLDEPFDRGSVATLPAPERVGAGAP